MRTALVVEDDPSIQDLMGQLLREQGFGMVLTAADRDTALAHAKRQPLDLVVLDYVLRGQSGIEIAEQLRALPGFDAPVLVTTALPQRQAEEACEAAGACECVLKPFDITAFLEAVQTCLESQQLVR